VENQLVFNNSYRGGGGTDYACNKISLYGGGNNPTTTSLQNEVFGFGVASQGALEYFTSNSHVFYTLTGGGTTYGTERLRIASNGNIGIGTVSPFSTLHLHANSTTADVRMVLSDNTSTAGAGKGLHIMKYSDNQAYIWNYENTAMMFATNALERMRIASNGNIGIGTNAIPSNSLIGTPILAVGTNGYGISGDNGPSSGGIYIGDSVVAARWRISHGSYNMNLFQNNGSGTYDARGSFANSTGVYSSVSDKRLKKLIEPIQYGLNDVLKFKPVSYFMENQNQDVDKRNLGFIAQDLEYIIPEIVNVPSTSNAVYSLQYTTIIPILIKAIQELNEIVTKNTNTSNMIV